MQEQPLSGKEAGQVVAEYVSGSARLARHSVRLCLFSHSRPGVPGQPARTGTPRNTAAPATANRHDAAATRAPANQVGRC